MPEGYGYEGDFEKGKSPEGLRRLLMTISGFTNAKYIFQKLY